MYYDQAQSSQHPKRDKDDKDAEDDEDDKDAEDDEDDKDDNQPSQHPKRGTASTKLVLQSSTIQPVLINLVLQSARLPSVSQKSRFRNLLDFPWSVKNLDSGWGTANPETCPIAIGRPKKSRFLLGKRPKDTPENRAHGHSRGGI